MESLFVCDVEGEMLLDIELVEQKKWMNRQRLENEKNHYTSAATHKSSKISNADTAKMYVKNLSHYEMVFY